MAWFGDGLSSLSNLKGQITNFTKEVLSEGIVEEIDERSRNLEETNERCMQLEELLNSKDAEISLLRRQNSELQKAVVELNAKTKEANDVRQDDEAEGFFWDPTFVKNRNPRNQNNVRVLQEQLSQATLRIRELEAEVKRAQKVNNSAVIDEIPDGHQKAEFLRAKQDMVNRIIQMEEKTREAERNAKRMQLDEISLIEDFRRVIAKLEAPEKLDLVRGALKALETENEKDGVTNKEKSDCDEKSRLDSNERDSAPLKNNFEQNGSTVKLKDESTEESNKRELDLYRRIEELQTENKTLFENIEELDQQHAESIDKLLSIKGEIEKKHHCLQNAYEELYVDYNEAQNKVTELESALATGDSKRRTSFEKEIDCHYVQTETSPKEERETQVDPVPDNEDTSTEAKVRSELERKMKDVLKNCSVNAAAGETIFEAVAKHYVDAKWKKDVLERKVTEVTRDLKEAVDIKDTLQLECDDMQAHIDSLLMEIRRLKLNLPSIPEASEERVASLETETESLYEDVKRLQAEKDVLQTRNIELLNTVHNMEESLRSQENVEAEIRNIKQQLDIAKEQLEGASLNVQHEESTIEDLRCKLHASLDENNELRKTIDSLERTKRQMQEQVSMSLDKCKDEERKAKLIEELNSELQNVKEELNVSLIDIKQLESNIRILEEVKAVVEKDNEELDQKNEQLEVELSKWQETNLQNGDNALLQELSEQLEQAVREKKDLEYDIRNMRKELDTSLKEVDVKQSEIMKLSQDNENLAKENSSLVDQLTATQDDSLDKIELLNTEMHLLEQEHAEVKQQATDYRKELSEIKEKLIVKEKEYIEVEAKCNNLNSVVAEFSRENQVFQQRAKELEEELSCKVSAMEELTAVQDLASQRTEINLQSLQSKLAQFEGQDDIIKTLEAKLETADEKSSQLLREIAGLQHEKEELLLTLNKINNDNEKQEIMTIVEDQISKNNLLTNDNDKLKAEILLLQNKLQEALEANAEAGSMAKETIESLSHLIKEKDNEINNLNVLNLSTNAQISEDILTIKNERDELVKLVQHKHNESLQYHGEIQRLSQLLNEQVSQIQSLITEKETNLDLLKQKDIALLWNQNELQVMQQRLKNMEAFDNSSETCNIIEHSVQAKEITVFKEKSDALEAALIQEQSNSRMLQKQLNDSQNKEANSTKELERLRTHLVEMESSYTEEALIAEETRKELETKLLQADEKLKNSSTVYTSASIRANQQVETLEQQIGLIIQQRDDIQNKLSLAEDKILAQNASLTNLQLVLEQFQQDKEKDIAAATEKLQNRLNESQRQQEELAVEVTDLKDQLNEAKEYLQAASRLSEQLDKKTERIELLNLEVERLTNLVKSADQKIEEAYQNGEGKVDKTLIKNLLLGYLCSSALDKSSVLRVFATVLDFNESEKDKAGLNSAGAEHGWFSRLSNGSTATKDQDASLSAAFVKFLESESKPKPQLPALPISSSPLPRPGHSRQHSSSSTQSTLLLSNVNLPTFPDFVPARNTGSILKEVLKDS